MIQRLGPRTSYDVSRFVSRCLLENRQIFLHTVSKRVTHSVNDMPSNQVITQTMPRFRVRSCLVFLTVMELLMHFFEVSVGYMRVNLGRGNVAVT